MRRWLSISAVVSSLVFCIAGCESTPKHETSKRGDVPAFDDSVQPRLDASTYYAHGYLLERQGNFERAAAQYQAALANNPEYVAANNRLGIVLNKLGRHNEASQRFSQAIAHAPKQAYLYNNLGFSLYLEHKYVEAKEALRSALEIDPNFTRAQMNLGLVLGKQGQFADAFEAFQRACPQTDAYYNLAVVQTDAGAYDEAVVSLEHALELNPNFEPAKVQIAAIKQLAAEHQTHGMTAEEFREMVAANPEMIPAETVEPAETDEQEETATGMALTGHVSAEHPESDDHTQSIEVEEVENATDDTEMDEMIVE